MRYFNTSRLLRKQREWLKKDFITDIDLANMKEPLAKEVSYWIKEQNWMYALHSQAYINPKINFY